MSEPPLLVSVEYCSSCGFHAKAADLQKELEAAFGERVDVEIAAGKPKSFEITAGGELVYSKLGQGKFPTSAQALKLVQAKLGGAAGGDAVAAAERKEAEDGARAGMSDAEADALVERLTRENAVAVFSKTYCPYCKKAKEALRSVGQAHYVLELDENPDGDAVQAALLRKTSIKTVPQVFVRGKCVGGGDDTVRLCESGELQALVKAPGEAWVEMATVGGGAAGAGDAGKAVFPPQDIPLWLQWPLFFFPYNLSIYTARATAILNVLVCVVVAVWADERWAHWLAAAVAGDFFLRVLFGGRGSLLGTLGFLLARAMPVRMTPGAPKQFAQMIGFTMSGATTLVLFLDRSNDDHHLVARVLISVLAFFAALEGFANFCAGCWMFGFLVTFKLIKVDPGIKADTMAAEQHHTLEWIRRRLRQPPPRRVVFNAEQGKVPFVTKSKNEDHKKEDFDLVRHAHITFGGLHMGLAGVAFLFKVAESSPWQYRRAWWVGTGVFAATVYCAWLALFLLKAVLYPRKVLKEWHHPQQSNFFSGNLLVPVIYAFLVADEMEQLALTLFWVFAPLCLLVSLVLFARWISKWNYRGLIMPVWAIPPLANLVVAAVAPTVGFNNGHDYRDLAFFWYSLGVVAWIVLFTMVLQRAFFGAFLPDKMRSTLMIFVAAPAAVSLAHLAVTDQLGMVLGGTAQFDAFAKVTFFFALDFSLVMVVLTLTGYLGRYRYDLSYNAFAFPTAVLAANALVYHASARTDWSNAVAVVAAALALTVACVNAAHTVVMLSERHGFVPEAKFGPMGFFTKMQHYAMRESLRRMNALSRKLHRPEKLAEFARLFHVYHFVHKVHAEYEEGIVFPEIENFFRGLTAAHSHEHEDADADHHALEALLDTLVPGAREDALLEYNYYANADGAAAAKAEAGVANAEARAPTKEEIARLVELGERVEADTNAHFDSEEGSIGHFFTKYFNGKLGKKVAAKIFNAYPTTAWRVIVPFTVRFQELHKRRLLSLKSLQMVVPERMHMLGMYIYEAIDSPTWDRIRVDAPEIVPRHVQGHHRIF